MLCYAVLCCAVLCCAAPAPRSPNQPELVPNITLPTKLITTLQIQIQDPDSPGLTQKRYPSFRGMDCVVLHPALHSQPELVRDITTIC
ncbi:hypothetical protein BDV06DRAFT_187239 [Aspergillus oleicola]